MPFENISNNNEKIIVSISGAGLGLPGKINPVFDAHNIENLLKGKNCITKVDSQKIEVQKRQNIIQKHRINGNVEFKELTSENDLVSLAGEAGSFDLISEYGVGEGLIDAWDITTQLSIAAGLEALKDARIPLIRKEGKLSLPEYMINDTGIIFASTFPAANTFLEEQQKYYQYANYLEKKKNVEQLVEILGEKKRCDIERIMLEEERINYNFDRKYLLKAIPIQSGNFAQVINAKGPNTSINSACASTTQAIALAEDWIKLGRCKRVIVIAADDPTNQTTFGWIATGFLAAGAATTEDRINHAAKPFDRYRSGMILGMGAVGIVVETEEEITRRGIRPITKLLGSYFANSAYHGTRMNPLHVQQSFQIFMKQMLSTYALSLDEIAESCLYMSHETFTPPKGNAAKTEIEALERVFGDATRNIIISNTKGFTAHPMGVSFEDVATIKSMEVGIIPPVANLSSPEFDDYHFSSGEEVMVNYAIRFAAGFGSQLVYLLFENYHSKCRETEDYQKWLYDISGTTETNYQGKTLIIDNELE